MIKNLELKKLLKNDVNEMMDDWMIMIINAVISDIVYDDDVINKIKDKYNLDMIQDRKELARCILNLSCETFIKFYDQISCQENYLKFKKIIFKDV